MTWNTVARHKTQVILQDDGCYRLKCACDTEDCAIAEAIADWGTDLVCGELSFEIMLEVETGDDGSTAMYLPDRDIGLVGQS